MYHFDLYSIDKIIFDLLELKFNTLEGIIVINLFLLLFLFRIFKAHIYNTLKSFEKSGLIFSVLGIKLKGLVSKGKEVIRFDKTKQIESSISEEVSKSESSSNLDLYKSIDTNTQFNSVDSIRIKRAFEELKLKVLSYEDNADPQLIAETKDRICTLEKELEVELLKFNNLNKPLSAIYEEGENIESSVINSNTILDKETTILSPSPVHTYSSQDGTDYGSVINIRRFTDDNSLISLIENNENIGRDTKLIKNLEGIFTNSLDAKGKIKNIRCYINLLEEILKDPENINN
jgi:hypothetical protein